MSFSFVALTVYIQDKKKIKSADFCHGILNQFMTFVIILSVLKKSGILIAETRRVPRQSQKRFHARAQSDIFRQDVVSTLYRSK